MKRLLAVSLLFATLVWAQAPDAGQPAPSNVPNAQYPRINPDSSITFRIRASDAQKVTIGSGFGLGNYELVKGEGGYWTVTTKPLAPGFYYYSVNVDGFATTDPGSQTFFGSNVWSSALEVPGEESDFFAPKNVPHGAVRQQWYFSKSTGKWRRIIVYTPPNYDQRTSVRYPVLYLQHGMGENETSWSNQGRENFIMDNLIAAGKTKPMIVVNENGMTGATAGAGRGRGAAPAAARGEGAPAAPAVARGPSRAMLGNTFKEFEEIVCNELIPYIDSTFRTIADKNHRALAGLSMGGAQAIRIGIYHPEKFAYLAGFSPAIGNLDPKSDYDGKLADAAAINKQFKLIWLGIGTGDSLHDGVKASHDNLEQAGIRHVWVESSGAHVWTVWRKYLTDLAPRLF
jgi:enterochelin esterase family protein